VGLVRGSRVRCERRAQSTGTKEKEKKAAGMGMRWGADRISRWCMRTVRGGGGGGGGRGGRGGPPQRGGGGGVLPLVLVHARPLAKSGWACAEGSG